MSSTEEVNKRIEVSKALLSNPRSQEFIAPWLHCIGMEKYASRFQSEEIDGESLLQFDHFDLMGCGVEDQQDLTMIMKELNLLKKSHRSTCENEGSGNTQAATGSEIQKVTDGLHAGTSRSSTIGDGSSSAEVTVPDASPRGMHKSRENANSMFENPARTMEGVGRSAEIAEVRRPSSRELKPQKQHRCEPADLDHQKRFVWQWQADNGEWKDYEPSASKTLENTLKSGSLSCTVRSASGAYEIDFQIMRQRPAGAAHFTRAVRQITVRTGHSPGATRKETGRQTSSSSAYRPQASTPRYSQAQHGYTSPMGRPQTIWQWQTRSGWQDYSAEAAKMLEQAYQKKQQICVVPTPHGSFKVNFKVWTQCSISGVGQERKIQRIMVQAFGTTGRPSAGTGKVFQLCAQATNPKPEASKRQRLATADPTENPNIEACAVCLTARKTHAFVPCGHKCVCGECAIQVTRRRGAKCPLCRATVERVMQIKG